jgi:hypothetical protein
MQRVEMLKVENREVRIETRSTEGYPAAIRCGTVPAQGCRLIQDNGIACRHTFASQARRHFVVAVVTLCTDGRAAAGRARGCSDSRRLSRALVGPRGIEELLTVEVGSQVSRMLSDAVTNVRVERRRVARR